MQTPSTWAPAARVARVTLPEFFEEARLIHSPAHAFDARVKTCRGVVIGGAYRSDDMQAAPRVSRMHTIHYAVRPAPSNTLLARAVRAVVGWV